MFQTTNHLIIHVEPWKTGDSDVCLQILHTGDTKRPLQKNKLWFTIGLETNYGILRHTHMEVSWNRGIPPVLIHL